MHFHGTAGSMWNLAVAAMRSAGLATAAIAILLAGCSKQQPQNRYDWAMELAKTYSVSEVPQDFTATLHAPIAKDHYLFLDLIWGNSLEGKFQAAAAELSKQLYFQPDNASLLNDIIIDSKQACFIDEGLIANINCRDGEPFRQTAYDFFILTLAILFFRARTSFAVMVTPRTRMHHLSSSSLTYQTAVSV